MLEEILFKTGPEESAGFSAAPCEPILKEEKELHQPNFKRLFYLFNNETVFRKSSSCYPALWVSGLALCKKYFSVP